MTLSSLFFGANAILSPLITLSLVISTYFIGICIFRLWFSPLAKFPGPRLAALTGWTETYYEILHGDGGQFSKVYARWHEIYGKYRGPNLIVFVVMLKYTSLPGPIIRIKPDELHIQDASFFETLYVRSGSLDKLQSLENRFNNPSALLNTPKHSIHRIRRKALDPFFTRRKITEYVPTISEMLERICERIEKDFLVCSRILLIQEMWGCFSTEVIVNYCFGLSKQFIEAPDFRSAFHGAMMDIEDQVHIMTQFPILYRVMNLLPDRLIVWMQPKMSSMIDFNNEMANQVSRAIDSSRHGVPFEKESKNVLVTVLASELPPDELVPKRLQDECFGLVGAGIETVMRTLSVMTFHLLDNPQIVQKLHSELDRAIPDPRAITTLDELTRLPYLKACIEEGLRLTYGVATRLVRVLSSGPVEYEDYVIPADTAVSMDLFDVSHDKMVFPDSTAFRPERWLDDPDITGGKGASFSQYKVAFGRGARSCLGRELAYVELFLGIATIFRRFQMELYDTTSEAIEFHMDRFVPKPKPGTKGVRVLVTGLRP